MIIEQSKHICPVCGKQIQQSKYGYWTKYCSKSCATKAQRSNPENQRKLKETCIKKYGVDNPAKSTIVIDKAKQTCLSRYNGTSPMHSKLVRDKHDMTMINSKRSGTKLENGTFNTSKPEERSYIALLDKYPDTIRQYKSNQYPFNCDFYIPSLDLYIECNYHWTHGGYAYNKLTCSEKLQEWIEKSLTSNFYKTAIKTWTIRDVNKRNIAKQNNLNYIEFWKEKELYNWLSNDKDKNYTV